MTREKREADDLVERLRRYARFSKPTNKSWSDAMTEAADLIEELRTEDDDKSKIVKCEFGGDCVLDSDAWELGGAGDDAHDSCPHGMYEAVSLHGEVTLPDGTILYDDSCVHIKA